MISWFDWDQSHKELWLTGPTPRLLTLRPCNSDPSGNPHKHDSGPYFGSQSCKDSSGTSHVFLFAEVKDEDLLYQKSRVSSLTMKFIATLCLSALTGVSAIDAMAGSAYFKPRWHARSSSMTVAGSRSKVHGGSVKVNGSSSSVKVNGRHGHSYSW